MSSQPNGLASQNLPTITIDGVAYTLELSGLLPAYVLDSHGVRLENIMQQLSADEPGRIALTLKLFSALTANNFVKRGVPYLTPEQWAAKIPRDRLGEVIDAVLHVFLKVSPAADTAQELPANPVQ